MPYIPTPSSGGRNRYAEIMSQFGQSQPFSFFGMPPTYTGGFTPYQRSASAPALPVEIPTTSTTGSAGGNNANREGPSAFSQMTPAERAAYYAANPIEGSLALGVQDLFGNITLTGQATKYLGADNWYDSRLEKMGVNPTISLENQNTLAGEAMQRALDSQAQSQALQGAIAAANANTGLVANPMSLDPSQRVVSTPVVTAPPVVAPAITEGLLSTPIVEAPVPVVTAPPVVAPAPAPAPVPMMTVKETWKGEDSPDPGQGWTQERYGARDATRWVRAVPVAVSSFVDSEGNVDFGALQRAGYSILGIGGGQGSSGGGYTVGGYAPGSQAAAAAASGQFGMGPGTPGFNSGGAGFAKGGHVSMQRLQGPNPAGPDDGYAALKDGEYVINDNAVKKYGIELMEAINSGKISKGKLRGLLEM